MNYKWKVAEKPSGRYRSFYNRCWPSADYENKEPCAFIVCKDAYIPRNIKSGNHEKLTLLVADHSVNPWKWKKVKRMFATLDEAKQALAKVLLQHPEFIPKE